MKPLLLAFLIPALAMPVLAQGFQAKAALSTKDGKNILAWITRANDKQIEFKISEVATVTEAANIDAFSTIYLMHQEDFGEAVDIYEGGDYKAAKEKFVALKKRYEPIATLKDNFHTLSAFYEMESMRKLGDYKGLSEALQSFKKEPMTREHRLRQLDLYVMWDAVGSEKWDSVITMANERDLEDLPDYQRVQIAFGKGLALHKTGKSEEALIEYSHAMTADAGASETLVRKAALNSLEIYLEDENVKAAIASLKVNPENKSLPGYERLKRAAALAKLYEDVLNTAEPLPENYKAILPYAG
jgi:tetratricopeptide (TPR) repeat protein